MLTFRMHSRTAWNDFFPGTSSNNYNYQTYSSRQSLSGTNVHVSNSLFISITSTSNGGAFYSTSISCLLFESTSFFSCKSSGQFGGNIYFSNTGSGQCVLYKVCGYDCYSTSTDGSYGQFALIRMKNDATSKNYINYSSIVRCVNGNSNTHYMLCLEYGKNCCPSVNSSNNKCYHSSGISCRPNVYSNSAACSFTHSTFADNVATEFYCITILNSGVKSEIKSCNILRNMQASSSGGIIYTNGNTIIEGSCILGNKANYVFYQGSSSYTITLSDCTVDSTSNNGYLTTQNIVTKSFILALNHMSTRNCHSEYDAVGALTPIIQSPSSPKNQKLYCTFGNSLYQYRLGYLVSLISIFIFHFIHPYVFSYPLY
jgi:hypothetical protein